MEHFRTTRGVLDVCKKYRQYTRTALRDQHCDSFYGITNRYEDIDTICHGYVVSEKESIILGALVFIVEFHTTLKYV
jgi:hypothetical protein